MADCPPHHWNIQLEYKVGATKEFWTCVECGVERTLEREKASERKSPFRSIKYGGRKA